MEKKDIFQLNVRLPLWLKGSISEAKRLGFSPSIVTAYSLQLFFNKFNIKKNGRGRPNKSKEFLMLEDFFNEFYDKKSGKKVSIP